MALVQWCCGAFIFVQPQGSTQDLFSEKLSSTGVQPVVTGEDDFECMKRHDFISFIQEDEDHVLELSVLPYRRPFWYWVIWGGYHARDRCYPGVRSCWDWMACQRAICSPACRTYLLLSSSAYSSGTTDSTRPVISRSSPSNPSSKASWSQGCQGGRSSKNRSLQARRWDRAKEWTRVIGRF